MKLRILIVFACAILATLTASALKPSQMNDYACHQLKGKVKTVRIKSQRYNQDYTLTFDASGRLISDHNNTYPDYSVKYIYTSATRYGIKYQHSKNIGKMGIKYTALSRNDIGLNTESLPSTTYTFNKFGQLVEIHNQDPSYYVSITKYKYKNTTDKFPCQMIDEGGEGGESYNQGCSFTYDEFDSHGNWTKRTCKGISVSLYGEEVMDVESIVWTETRTITYY